MSRHKRARKEMAPLESNPIKDLQTARELRRENRNLDAQVKALSKGILFQHESAIRTAEFCYLQSEYDNATYELKLAFQTIIQEATHLSKGDKSSVSIEVLKGIDQRLGALHARWALAYRKKLGWDRRVDLKKLPKEAEDHIREMERLVKTHQEAAQSLLAREPGGKKAMIDLLTSGDYAAIKGILDGLSSIDVGGRKPGVSSDTFDIGRRAYELEQIPVKRYRLYDNLLAEYRELAGAGELDPVGLAAYATLRGWQPGYRDKGIKRAIGEYKKVKDK